MAKLIGKARETMVGKIYGKVDLSTERGVKERGSDIW